VTQSRWDWKTGLHPAASGLASRDATRNSPLSSFGSSVSRRVAKVRVVVRGTAQFPEPRQGDFFDNAFVEVNGHGRHTYKPLSDSKRQVTA
jgi:hypothetical protein